MKTPNLIFLCVLLAFASTASATVLTFDIDGSSNGMAMPAGYGDNVTSTTMGTFHYGSGGGFTPNIVLDYFTPPPGNTTATFWSTGFSDLTNVVNNEDDGENQFTIQFTAGSGLFVRLDGFDLGNFGSTVILPGLRVEDGSGNVLFSQSNISIPDSSQPHLDFDFASGLFGAQLKIIVDTTGLGGNSDNIGLDNIQFEESAVPEPTTWVMLVLGAAVGGLSLRQRRNA
jgi:hypothetical protein